MRNLAISLAVIAAVAAGAGCRQDMHDAPRYETYEAGPFFADGRAVRPQVKGTVARSQFFEEEYVLTGVDKGRVANKYPFPVTPELIARGEQRFGIYCSPCHGDSGAGDGTVVKKGFPQPTSLHDPRPRDMGHGYYIAIMRNGFGRMPSYAFQIPVNDRWAIVAFIRELQKEGKASNG